MTAKWFWCDQPEHPLDDGTQVHPPPCRGCAIALDAHTRMHRIDTDHRLRRADTHAFSDITVAAYINRNEGTNDHQPH